MPASTIDNARFGDDPTVMLTIPYSEGFDMAAFTLECPFVWAALATWSISGMIIK
jgi:hypothetical protein